MSVINDNQDPSYFSREYYLSSCAGSDVFAFGGDSTHALYRYIFETMEIDVKDKSVLDLGCGRGELCIASKRSGARKVVGVDFSQAAVALAVEHLNHCKDIKSNEVQFLHANALELNLNEKFDIIFLTDIVEHLYDDQLKILFKKVEEHLSPTGLIIVHTMPTKEFIYFGQWLKFIYYLFKGKKHHFLTFKSQAAVTHVNLHHKEQLARSLSAFDTNIWYDFADRSSLKAFISKTPLVRFISGNLWAVATRKKDKV